MKRQIIILISAVLVVSTIYISVNQYIKRSNYSRYVPSRYNTGLEHIKLKDSKFATVRDQYLLLGKTREEIESIYTYTDKGKFGQFDQEFYFLDDCTVILYDTRKMVVQVSTGDYFTQNCFEETTLPQKNRLEYFGTEDYHDYYQVNPGTYDFLYAKKGISILKHNQYLVSIWMTRPFQIDEYKKYYSLHAKSDDAKPKVQDFANEAVLDENGKPYPQKDEE